MHACLLALADLDSTRQPMTMHDIWKYTYDATSMHMYVHTAYISSPNLMTILMHYHAPLIL